jgi:twitching motility protein PilI
VARKTSLREFQQRVAERLALAATKQSSPSKLGFQVAGRNWLVNLDEVREVIPVPTMSNVPLTKRWYLGVANVRGDLYSVVDFSMYQGNDATAGGFERRVILLSDKIMVGSGILVSRMLGLRNLDQLERVPAPESSDKAWYSGAYRDQSGAVWRDLNVRALAEDEQFLAVG